MNRSRYSGDSPEYLDRFIALFNSLLVLALVSGASCIDVTHVLCSGTSWSVLSHRVMEPSMLNTFLQRFSFGNVHKLDHAFELLMTLAGPPGAGPVAEPMTIDVDSTILEV